MERNDQRAPVTARLLARYYRNGQALAIGASSHWQSFSRHFSVTEGEDGVIQELSGYGFGESDRPSIASRLCSSIGAWLHLLLLKAPGLRAEVALARKVVSQMGLYFSFDAFRQACSSWLIIRAIAKGDIARPSTILVIGDGHGILSAMLHCHFPSAHIFLADLGSTLLFQAAYLTKAFPSVTHHITDEGALGASSAIFDYCPADQIEHFPPVTIDLAVNVASMQEMTPAVVADYFRLLRERHTQVFYCCNRLEKRLPGGEVLRFMNYPWLPSDQHLIDEACPWHQWFFGPSRAEHVRISGVPIPLLHRYDGVHWHRLTRLGRNS